MRNGVLLDRSRLTGSQAVGGRVGGEEGRSATGRWKGLDPFAGARRVPRSFGYRAPTGSGWSPWGLVPSPLVVCRQPSGTWKFATRCAGTSAGRPSSLDNSASSAVVVPVHGELASQLATDTAGRPRGGCRREQGSVVFHGAARNGTNGSRIFIPGTSPRLLAPAAGMTAVWHGAFGTSTSRSSDIRWGGTYAVPAALDRGTIMTAWQVTPRSGLCRRGTQEGGAPTTGPARRDRWRSAGVSPRPSSGSRPRFWRLRLSAATDEASTALCR